MYSPGSIPSSAGIHGFGLVRGSLLYGTDKRGFHTGFSDSEREYNMGFSIGVTIQPPKTDRICTKDYVRRL
jgi:hypothetical protein